MRKLVFGVVAVSLLMATGCESMGKMGDALKKMNDESNARIEANRKAALLEAHLQQNQADTLRGVSVAKVAVAVEKVMTAKGYSCHDVNDNAGATGDGVRVDCDKRKATDLGAAVGMNVLGNMLGADRGKIIKEEVDENSTYVRTSWAADGLSSAGMVGFGQVGKRYKINQNDQHVDHVDYNLSERAAFADAVRAAVQP